MCAYVHWKEVYLNFKLIHSREEKKIREIFWIFQLIWPIKICTFIVFRFSVNYKVTKHFVTSPIPFHIYMFLLFHFIFWVGHRKAKHNHIAYRIHVLRCVTIQWQICRYIFAFRGKNVAYFSNLCFKYFTYVILQFQTALQTLLTNFHIRILWNYTFAPKLLFWEARESEREREKKIKNRIKCQPRCI